MTTRPVYITSSIALLRAEGIRTRTLRNTPYGYPYIVVSERFLSLSHRWFLLSRSLRAHRHDVSICSWRGSLAPKARTGTVLAPSHGTNFTLHYDSEEKQPRRGSGSEGEKQGNLLFYFSIRTSFFGNKRRRKDSPPNHHLYWVHW